MATQKIKPLVNIILFGYRQTEGKCIMSNLRKCTTRGCKKEINIKDKHYAILHSVLHESDSKRKEYYCNECGKALLDKLGTGGSWILNALRQYIHMGPGLNWIKSIKQNGLLTINLDSKLKGEETEIVTFSEMIDNCTGTELEKAELREKYHAKCSGL